MTTIGKNSPASTPNRTDLNAPKTDATDATDAANAASDACPATPAPNAEATEPRRAVSSQVQSSSRSKASSSGAALQAKLNSQLPDDDATAALKELHPLAQGDGGPETKPDIEKLQQALKDKGLYDGPINGTFDAATDKAVRAYQKQNGLQVDGIVGQQTWGSLLGVKVPPGVNLLKPWAKGFTHSPAQMNNVNQSPTGEALRDKAKSMYGQPFLDKLDSVSSKIGVPPESLLKVMNNESGLRTDAVNPRGGATGLIQFMPATARGLGTTTEALKNMSATQQLDYVAKYYAPYNGKLHSATDLYTVTFYPAMLGKPDDYVVGGANAGLIARENPIFDIDGDGVITAKNFRDYCKRKFGE
jgi:peptidoglycan hydrolase-like protein with peptidoglycan-binding domain